MVFGATPKMAEISREANPTHDLEAYRVSSLRNLRIVSPAKIIDSINSLAIFLQIGASPFGIFSGSLRV